MKKPILYLDMDQVLVDFNSSSMIPDNEKEVYNHDAIYKKGFFINLRPMAGALLFVQNLIKANLFDIQILTQPVAGNVDSYVEKAMWVEKYLPQLTNKINMSQNKLLFRGDILIDDNSKWSEFEGKFILFDYKNPELAFKQIERLLFNKYSGIK